MTTKGVLYPTTEKTTKVVLDSAIKKELKMIEGSCTEFLLWIIDEGTFQELFEELVRQYAYKGVSNDETRCACVTFIKGKDQIKFELLCDCTEGSPCKCDTMSNPDFYCSATYKGEEIPYSDTPIKLQFVNDGEGNSCSVSCVP
jgi:hypothetical protein